jgi:GH15 family glucan-1,4-alpha-glucosidase
MVRASPSSEVTPPESSARAGEPAGYRPLRDYAAVGDCHGVALVSREGSVDWCCLRRFDADPACCRILDVGRGGFLELHPDGEFLSARAYLPATNVLRTTFTTPAGEATATDFMPVGRAPGSRAHDYVTLVAPHRLVRLVEGVRGTVSLALRYRPTVDWGREPARLAPAAFGVSCNGGPALLTEAAVTVTGDVAAGTIAVSAGERRAVVLTSDADARLAAVSGAEAARQLAITRAFWEEWADYCRYEGPYRDAVLRSALTLKLLTYAPTGAIVAAATTSLPEGIGGERNWDYRYCWLRDATFTLYALEALGYRGEARRFSRFLTRACTASSPRVQIMYGIGGEIELPERTLDHLDGYRGSRPVRTGNGAYRQRQLDVYSEVLDWAWLLRRLGIRLGAGELALFRTLADFTRDHWDEPGQGIWEMRGPPRHHVYGKIMAWVALDRATRLLGDHDGYLDARRAILAAVREHGIEPGAGNLRQVFDHPGVDAALLMAPDVDFPLDGPTLQATVDAVRRRLGQGDFLRRYEAADGVGGGEGAFLICSFWLVDALLFAGRAAEARELFERMLSHANDVGLFSEEIDPATGEFLGNVPQAFTHLALIHSAVTLALFEKRGPAGLRGTHADRARHAAAGLTGWRGIGAHIARWWRTGRVRSSRASVLDPAAPRG